MQMIEYKDSQTFLTVYYTKGQTKMIHCFPPAFKVSEIPPHYLGSQIRVHNPLLSAKASSTLEKEDGLMVVVVEKEVIMEI